MTASMKDLPGPTRRLWALVLLAGAAACGETSLNEPLPPASITVVGGTTRAGVAGQRLAEPVEVIVLGSDNQPLPGAQVTFTATGAGATADPASATTDAQGIARTRWTLPHAVGESALNVAAGGATAQLTAAVSAGPAASAAAAAGATQQGVVGTAAATPPAVRVVDAHGNPVPGATVTFSVLSGGGTVTDLVRVTNAQGTAAVGSWVFGPTPGAQTLLGRVEQAGVTGNPVIFTATVAGGAAAQITPLSAATQTAPAGTAVTVRPSVRVADAFGNPVQGAAVTFAVAAGGGQVSGGAQTTNAQGIATVGGWTLGAQAGANQLTASVPGAGSVSFSATGTAGAATQLVAVAGNNQNGQVSRAVEIAPRVVARDAGGNPVPGVIVTFAVTSGGGTAVSSRQTTDATGTAEVGAWILGTTPGPNTLTASAAGLTPVVFTATAAPGQPASMLANSTVTQGGTVSATVADPPSVIVRDIAGNPVPGLAVTFAVTAGGGTVTGATGTAATSVTVTTSASGTATLAAWRLGPLVEANRVVASATGVPSITFTATPGAGPPASVTAIAGVNAVAVQGTAVQSRPAVRVLDASGNAVVGATVFFSVISGGGSITGATQETDAAGIARVGSWTLGAATNNVLRASVTDAAGNQLSITGNPVTFTAQSATDVDITSAPVTGTRGVNFSISARLEDASGNPVLLAGVPLTIQIASGGGTLQGITTVNTSGTGAVTFTLNVTGSAGERTFVISGPGLNPVTTGTITFN